MFGHDPGEEVRAFDPVKAIVPIGQTGPVDFREWGRWSGWSGRLEPDECADACQKQQDDGSGGDFFQIVHWSPIGWEFMGEVAI